MNRMNIMLENLQKMTKHIYEQYEYHTAITDIGQNSSKTNERQSIQICDKTQVKKRQENYTDMGQNPSKTNKRQTIRMWTKLK